MKQFTGDGWYAIRWYGCKATFNCKRNPHGRGVDLFTDGSSIDTQYGVERYIANRRVATLSPTEFDDLCVGRWEETPHAP